MSSAPRLLMEKFCCECFVNHIIHSRLYAVCCEWLCALSGLQHVVDVFVSDDFFWQQFLIHELGGGMKDVAEHPVVNIIDASFFVLIYLCNIFKVIL